MSESNQTGAPEPGTAVSAPYPDLTPAQAAELNAILEEEAARRGLPPMGAVFHATLAEDGAR